MAEYSKLARGTFVTTGNAHTINLPFVPQIVKLYNLSGYSTTTAGQLVQSYWDSNQTSTFNLVWATTGTSPTSSYVSSFVTTPGITTFSNSLSGIFGAQQQVASVATGNPTVFTVTAHGYANNDTVIFEGLYQSPTTGMPQMCGIPFAVNVLSANTFSVLWPSTGSNYTALSGSPAGAFVKKVLNPASYEPKNYVISGFSYGTTTQIQTTALHNLVVGSTVAFRMPAIWGAVQFNSNSNPFIPGSPIYGTVLSIPNGVNVVVDINSTTFTPFNTNVPVTSVPGLTFPQMVAVGDLNTGGGTVIINSIPTINGPAISGAFVNNTAQGFTIPVSIIPTASQTISWEASYCDITDNA